MTRRERLISALIWIVSPIAVAWLIVELLGCSPRIEDAVKKPSPTPAPPTIAGVQTQRWTSAKIRPEKLHFVQALAQIIMRNRGRYNVVAVATSVPWDVIGAIHNLECSLSFRQHLFNGDSLNARTRHVPAGQPKAGSPPFAWEESAIASLRYDALDKTNWRNLEGWLWAIERYNGRGYDKYHPDVPTPYLWSWTTLYVRGKYIADGTWSATAVSEQCGVAALLKTLR